MDEFGDHRFAKFESFGAGWPCGESGVRSVTCTHRAGAVEGADITYRPLAKDIRTTTPA